MESDHYPLQWLNKVKGRNLRLLRWSLFLQEFSFKVKHIKGKENKVADMLSRSFESDKRFLMINRYYFII